MLYYIVSLLQLYYNNPGLSQYDRATEKQCQIDHSFYNIMPSKLRSKSDIIVQLESNEVSFPSSQYSSPYQCIECKLQQPPEFSGFKAHHSDTIIRKLKAEAKQLLGTKESPPAKQFEPSAEQGKITDEDYRGFHIKVRFYL